MAYFAVLLGLPFVAMMPGSTSAAKVALIESQGGRCHFVADSSQVYAEAERVAQEPSACWPKWSPKAAAVRWSHCSPIAAIATSTPTSTTRGSARKAWTQPGPPKRDGIRTLLSVELTRCAAVWPVDGAVR